MKISATPDEKFAAAVASKLKEDQRSVAWLSRQIGVHPSTIGYQLKRPSAISLRTACQIRDVLGVEL